MSFRDSTITPGTQRYNPSSASKSGTSDNIITNNNDNINDSLLSSTSTLPNNSNAVSSASAAALLSVNAGINTTLSPEQQIVQLTSKLVALRKWNSQLDERLTLSQEETNRWRAHYELAQETVAAIMLERDHKDALNRDLTNKLNALGEVVMNQSRDTMTAQRVLADAEAVSVEEARKMELSMKQARAEADAAVESARLAVQRASTEAANRIMAAAAQHDRELAELKDRHAQETSNMLAASAAELQNLRTEFELKNQELSQQISDLQRELATEKETHAANVARIQDIADKEINFMKDETAKQIISLQQETEQEITRIKDTCDTEVKALSEELNTRTAYFHSEVDRLARERQQRLAQVALEHNRTLTDMANEYEEAQNALVTLHNDEMKEVTDNFNNEKEALLKENAMNKAQHAQELAETLALHGEEITKILANHADELTKLIAQHTDTLNASNTQHAQDIADLKAELVNLQTVHAEEIEALHTKYTADIKDLEAKHAQEIADEKTKLMETEAQHAVEMTELRGAHATELANVAAQLKETIDDYTTQSANATEAHANELAEINKEHTKQLSELMDVHSTQIAERDRAQIELQEAFSRAMNEAQAAADAQLQEAVTDLRESAAELERRITAQAEDSRLQLETAIADYQQRETTLREQYEVELTALRDTTDGIITQLQEELDRVRKDDETNLNETIDTYEKLLQSIRSQTTNALDEATKLHAATVADLEKTQIETLNRATTEAEERLRKAVEEIENKRNSEISTLKESYIRTNNELEERYRLLEESARKSLEELEAQEHARLETTKESHMLEVEALQQRHAADIESMRAGYEKLHASGIDNLTLAYDRQLEVQEARIKERDETITNLRAQITELRNSREDAVVARVAEAQRAYNSERRALEVELASVRSTLERMKAEQDALLSMSSEADTALARARAEHAAEVSALVDAHEGGIRDVTASALAREADLETEFDMRMADMEARHANEVYELRAAVAEVTALADRANAEHEAELTKLKMLYEAAVENMHAAHDAASREAEAMTDARVAAAKAEASLIEGAVLHAKERSDLASRLSRESQAVNAVEERESALAEMKAHYEGLLREVRLRSDRIVEGINANHEAEVRALRDSYEKEKKEAAEHAAALAATISDVRASYETLGQSVTSNAREAFEARLRTFTEKIEAYELMIVQIRAELDETRKVAFIEQQGRVEATNEITELRSALASSMEAAHAAADNHEKELAAIRAAYETTLIQLRELNENNLSLLRSSYERQLSDLTEAHQQQKIVLSEEAERTADAARSDIVAKSKEAAEGAGSMIDMLRNQIRNLENTLVEEKVAHTRDTDELRRTHDRAVASALQNFLLREEALKASAASDRSNLQSEHTKALNTLQTQVDILKKEVDRRDAELRALMALNSDHGMTIAELKVRDEAALSALIEAHELAVRDLEAQAAEREILISKDAENEINSLREGYESRIAELLHQIDTLSEAAIRARNDAEKEALQMKELYAQGIAALKLTHEKAVEEAMLTAEVQIATTEATAANVEQAVLQGAARTEAVLRSNADLAIAAAHDERDKAIANAMVAESNLYTDLKARHELIITDLTAAHMQELMAIRERHANDMKAMKEQHDKLNVTLAEVRAAYASAISGSVDSLTEAMTSKTAVLDDQLINAERVILDLRKQLADTQALLDAASKREDEIRNYSVASITEALNRANQVETALRTRIDELTTQLASERLEANRRESDLRNQLIQTEAQSTNKDVNTQVTELKSIYESAMKEWKHTQEDTVTALKASSTSAEAEHVKAAQEVEKRLTEAHARELAALKAEAEAQSRIDTMKHNAEMADLVSRLTQAQAALGTNGSATSQLQQQERGHEQALTALRTAYESQIAEVNQRLARQEERLLADTDKRLGLLKSTYEAREAQLQADHVTIVAELRSRIAQLESILDRNSTDNNRQLQAAKEAADAATAQIRASHETALNELKASYDRNLAQALSNLVNKESQLKAAFAVERAETQANHSKQQLQLHTEMESLRKVVEDKLSTEESITVLRTHYQTEITRIQEEHVREITVLHQEHVRTVEEVKLVTKQENDKRTNESVTKENQIRAEYAVQISSLQNRIRELTATIAQLSVDHGKQMSDMMAQQAATLVSLRAAAERAANERAAVEKLTLETPAVADKGTGNATPAPAPAPAARPFVAVRLANVNHDYMIKNQDLASFQATLLADLAKAAGVSPDSLAVQAIRAGSVVVLVQSPAPSSLNKLRTTLATPEGRKSVEQSSAVAAIPSAALEDPLQPISITDASDDFDENGERVTASKPSAPITLPATHNPAVDSLIERHAHELTALRDSYKESIDGLVQKLKASESALHQSQKQVDQLTNELTTVKQQLSTSQTELSKRLSVEEGTKLKEQLSTTETKLKETQDALEKLQFDTNLQIQELNEALASAKAVSDREVSILKHAHLMEVKEIRDALSRAVSRRNSIEGGAMDAAAAAAAEVAELSSRIAHLQAENSRTLADIESRHATALAEAQGKYKAAVAALNEATAASEMIKGKAVAEAREEALQRSAEVITMHQTRANDLESKLAALEDKRVNELSAAEARHANEITSLMDKYAKEIADLNRKLVEKEEARFTDYKTIEERKVEELAATNARYDSRIKAIEEQAANKEQEIQRNAEANVERIRKDMEALQLVHKAEIQKLQASVDEEKARIQAKVEEISATLNKQHAAAMKAETTKAKTDRETALEEARVRAEKTLNTVRDDLRKQLATADNRITELSLQIVAEQAKSHGRAETISSLRKHITDLENERNLLRTQMEKDAEKSTKATEKAVAQVKEMHTMELSKVNSENEATVRALKADYERQRAEDAVRYSEAVADGREAQIKELESKYKAQYEDLNRSLEEKLANSKNTINILQNQLSDSNQAHAAAEKKLQNLASSLADTAAAQEKDWINRVVTLESAYESKVSQLQEALLTSERMAERATMDFSAAIVEAKAAAVEEAQAANRTAEAIRVRVEADMRDLHAAHALEIERIQAMWAAKVSSAEAEASAKLVTAAAESNQRLNELYRTTKDTAATLEKEYQQRLEEAVNRERKAKEHALRDAEAQAKAAMDSVNASYEREIAELRAAHERAKAETARSVAQEVAKHSEEITQLHQNENERIKKLQDNQEEKLRNLQKTHDNEISMLRRALAEADARSAELETSVKTLTADFQTSLAKADADAASRVAAAVSTAAAESNRLSAEYAHNLAALRTAFTDQVAAAEEQLAKKLQDEANKNIETIKKDAATKLEDQKAEAKLAYDQVSAELTKVSIELSKLQAEHSGCGPVSDQLRNNMNMMLENERQSHLSAIAAVQKEANEALERAQQAAYNTSQQVKLELEAFTKAHDEEISGLHKILEQTKIDYTQSLENLKDFHTKDKEQAIQDLTKKHTEEVTKLRDEAEAKLASTKDEYEKLLTKLREDADADVNRAKAEAEVAIAQAKEEANIAVANAAADAAKAVEEARTEAAATVAKVQADMEGLKERTSKDLAAAKATYDELLQAAALTEARRQAEIRTYESKLENAEKELRLMEDRANNTIRNTEERGRANQLALEASTADIQARLNAAIGDRARLLTRERELITKVDELSRTINSLTANSSSAVSEASAAKVTLDREARRWTAEKEAFIKNEAELREQLKERTASAEALQERAARALAASAAQTKHLNDEHDKLIRSKDEQITRLKGLVIEAQREVNRLRGTTDSGRYSPNTLSPTSNYGSSNTNNAYSLEDLASMNFDDMNTNRRKSPTSNSSTSIGAIEANTHLLPPSINNILGESLAPASGVRQEDNNSPPRNSSVTNDLRDRMKKQVNKK